MERGVSASYDRMDALMALGSSDAESTFNTGITATLSVRDWSKAVEFYKKAFGAKELYRVDGGGVARLSVDGAEFWVAEESTAHKNFSPETLGGCSVRMLLSVADPAAVCEQAVAAGATQITPVADAHGWRIGRIVDPAGHHWEVATQVECG
jgi:PhnB protein